MNRDQEKAMHAKKKGQITYKDVDGKIHHADSRKSFVAQTILFNQDHFTPAQAKKWLQEHNKSTYLDIKKEKQSEGKPVIRARQVSPSKFDENTLRTKEIEKGVMVVGGHLKQ